MVQVGKDIFLGNRLNIVGRDARQDNFLRRCILRHTCPLHGHHKAEEPAQIQIIRIDRPGRAHLYKVQIMQVIHHIIRDIQIRRMAVRVDHVDIAAHFPCLPSPYFAKL